MLKPITSDQMYRIEENGHSVLGMRRFLMMENAGHGTADFVVHKFKNLKNKRIVAVCGTGNNGGDGFVAACRKNSSTFPTTSAASRVADS